MDVDAIAVAGIWWRQTPHGGDPLFGADPPSDGRWQRGETIGGLYFADNEQAAWAEWYRALAEFAIPPERQMPSASFVRPTSWRDAMPLRPPTTYRRAPVPPTGMTT